jgi:hypothetical protein
VVGLGADSNSNYEWSNLSVHLANILRIPTVLLRVAPLIIPIPWTSESGLYDGEEETSRLKAESKLLTIETSCVPHSLFAEQRMPRKANCHRIKSATQMWHSWVYMRLIRHF